MKTLYKENTVSELHQIYSTLQHEQFPEKMEISFITGDDRSTLVYEKVQWTIDGEKKGLRYGENPGQDAALYRLTNGNLRIGEVKNITPGHYLASDVELLRSGKHPGKTNITDIDNALNILRYLTETPCTVIVKHNNPCGVARADSLAESYARAYMADRIAAFGGAVAVNRELDRQTAKLISESYVEVVAAPEFAPGAVEILAERKNLRIMRIARIAGLQNFKGSRFLDFKSLIDGGIIAQWSYVPVSSPEDFIIPQVERNGKTYRIRREPTEKEKQDMLFGWLVESGITSNSVIYVKDGVTLGIGTGEQDRVGVAEIARDKAYRKYADRISWNRYGEPFAAVTDQDKRDEIMKETSEKRGGLPGSVMISDAFFPFRDGIEVGLREGVTAVLQPGGSLRDYESIEACNEYNAAMLFTGQRSFKH